jgi:hypothetical protein
VTEHKVECLNCHLAIQHKVVKAEEYARADCQSCHPNFHEAQEMLFTGRGGRGVPSLPSPMYEGGLGCRGCHLFHSTNGSTNGHERGETLVTRPESCEVCHGKGYGELLKRWEVASEEKVREIARIYRRVERDTVHLPEAKRIEVREKLADARYNIDLVMRGKGVHNVQYADRLLAVTYTYLAQAAATTSPGMKLPAFAPSTANIPSECSACHYGQEEVDTKAFGWRFSHRRHIVENQLKCTKCHSNLRRHGELIMTKNDCMQCHHHDQKKACQSCHELQAKVYAGTIDLLGKEEPSAMFQAEVECQSCHIDQDRIVRPKPAACLSCHELGYEEMMTEWQKGVQEAIGKAEARAREIGDRPEAERLRKGIDLVRRDGSLGVHNVEMIHNLLDKGTKEMTTKGR